MWKSFDTSQEKLRRRRSPWVAVVGIETGADRVGDRSGCLVGLESGPDER